jgi:hypothetical protein
VPLSAIERLGPVSLNDADHSPAIYIRTSPIGGTSLDMPFIFNLTGASRESFLAIFRGDAVQDVDMEPGRQPWIPSDVPDSFIPDVVEHEAVSPVATPHEPETPISDVDSSEVEEPAEDDFHQFETWIDTRRPTTFMTGFGDERLGHRRIDDDIEAMPYSTDMSGTRLADALTAWPGLVQPVEEASPAPPTITEPRMLLTYLAKARRSIEEVNEAVDRRIAGHAAPLLRAMPPSSDEQSKALAELIELAGTDYYSVEQARSVKTQITRLGEASVRLRSLLELCNAGHMTISEVGLKRDAIMSGLPIEDGIE